jgi:imidazolonepropionase-like amidohydrolase
MIAFRNVILIDMTGEEPKPNTTVVIVGERILKIGKNIKIPKNAEVIDASGKFLIPGLWDMHVHIFNNVSNPGTNNKDDYFPLFIANGVTGVRDMFTDPDDIKLLHRWQSEIDAGKVTAPHIFAGSGIGLFYIKTPDISFETEFDAGLGIRDTGYSENCFYIGINVPIKTS